MPKKAKVSQVLTSTVSSLVSDAFSELQGLGEELREWYDNLPEQFQENRSDIDDAASALEYLEEPDECPEVVAAVEVKYYNTMRNRTGRSARGSQATHELGCAVAAMEEWMEGNAEHKDHDDVEAFRDSVQALIDEADGVEYPGMYG